jgi:hypothetical protein
MSILTLPPTVSAGQVRTFGPFGEKYEVIKPFCQLEDGDWMIKVKVLETDEYVEYRYSDLIEDPEAV